MKPLNLAISVAVLALPLCAVAQNMPNTTTTVLNQPAPTQAQDSPLVRAAKASGRLNKKPAIVITNDTLVRTGSHFASMDITTTGTGTQTPTDTAGKARRNAAALTLQRLKNSGNARVYGELAKPAARQSPLAPAEGQRMSTTELDHVSTTQLGTISTTQLGTTSTTQLGTMGTSQLGAVPTVQPGTWTTVKPPAP